MGQGRSCAVLVWTQDCARPVHKQAYLAHLASCQIGFTRLILFEVTRSPHSHTRSPNIIAHTADLFRQDFNMIKGVILVSTVVAMCSAQHQPNIVELASETPALSTLVTALKAANLTGALSGPGPFTVFAPSNLAFDALPPGVLQHLLDPRNVKELTDLLLYHVASGTYQAADLKNFMLIKVSSDCTCMRCATIPLEHPSCTIT